MSDTKKVSIDKLKPNPDNPRIIKDDKFKKLVQSIKDFPEMLKLRPIVVDKDMVVLGGNMRLRALKDAGVKDVEVIIADNLTDDQKREFIIKDNVGFGEWNWETLANEWHADQLSEWGMDIPKFDDNTGEIEPSGYELSSQWFINIQFENEEQCQEWYEKLTKEGLICKIIQ